VSRQGRAPATTTAASKVRAMQFACKERLCVVALVKPPHPQCTHAIGSAILKHERRQPFSAVLSLPLVVCDSLGLGCHKGPGEQREQGGRASRHLAPYAMCVWTTPALCLALPPLNPRQRVQSRQCRRPIRAAVTTSCSHLRSVSRQASAIATPIAASPVRPSLRLQRCFMCVIARLKDKHALATRSHVGCAHAVITARKFAWHASSAHVAALWCNAVDHPAM